jgi:hypothetical protein
VFLHEKQTQILTKKKGTETEQKVMHILTHFTNLFPMKLLTILFLNERKYTEKRERERESSAAKKGPRLEEILRVSQGTLTLLTRVIGRQQEAGLQSRRIYTVKITITCQASIVKSNSGRNIS